MRTVGQLTGVGLWSGIGSVEWVSGVFLCVSFFLWVFFLLNECGAYEFFCGKKQPQIPTQHHDEANIRDKKMLLSLSFSSMFEDFFSYAL